MISPTSGFVLIKLLPKQQGSSSFIVSTKDTNNQLQEIGEVIAVPTRKETANDVLGVGEDLSVISEKICPCEKGDKVVFLSWTFDQVTYNNEVFKLVKYEDIRGIITD